MIKTPQAPSPRALPQRLMLAVALGQGVLLYTIYMLTENNWAALDRPLWSLPLWTIAITSPLVFLLSVHTSNIVGVWRLTAAVTAVLATLAIPPASSTTLIGCWKA